MGNKHDGKPHNAHNEHVKVEKSKDVGQVVGAKDEIKEFGPTTHEMTKAEHREMMKNSKPITEEELKSAVKEIKNQISELPQDEIKAIKNAGKVLNEADSNTPEFTKPAHHAPIKPTGKGASRT